MNNNVPKPVLLHTLNQFDSFFTLEEIAFGTGDVKSIIPKFTLGVILNKTSYIVCVFDGGHIVQCLHSTIVEFSC